MAVPINDTRPRVQYTATSGQTVFAVPFEFFENVDLKIYNGGTLLVYDASPADGTEYSVTGAGADGGGSITLGSGGAAAGDRITILRDVPVARTTDFPLSGPFQIESLNVELSRLTAQVQQLEARLDTRVLEIDQFDVPGSLSRLPVKADRAGLMMGFDEDGNPAAVIGSDGTGGLLDLALQGSSGANRVGFIQSGTGAVARTVTEKVREIVSVKDYGAVGDGTTDDLAAIHAALAAHDEVFVPAGTYGVSASVIIPSGKTLRGAGRDKTFITPLDGFGPLPAGNGGIGCALTATDVRIADLTWHGNEQNLDVAGPNGTTNAALRIHGICPRGTNFIVERCGSNGVYYAFYASGNGANPASGVFRDCTTENFSVAFETNEANGVLWDNCVAYDGDATMGLEAVLHPLANSQNVTYRKCRYTGAAGSGVNVQGNVAAQVGIVFEDCRIEMTGNTVPFSVSGANGSEILVRGGLFKKPTAGESVVNASGPATILASGGAKFEGGAAAIYLNGPTMIGNGARIVAGTNPAGSDAATGIIATGGGAATWAGPGSINVTGPGGGLTNVSAGNVTIGSNVTATPAIPGAQTLVNGPWHGQVTGITNEGSDSYGVIDLPFSITDILKVTAPPTYIHTTYPPAVTSTSIKIHPFGPTSLVIFFKGANLAGSGVSVNVTVTEFA